MIDREPPLGKDQAPDPHEIPPPPEVVVTKRNIAKLLEDLSPEEILTEFNGKIEGSAELFLKTFISDLQKLGKNGIGQDDSIEEIE